MSSCCRHPRRPRSLVRGAERVPGPPFLRSSVAAVPPGLFPAGQGRQGRAGHGRLSGLCLSGCSAAGAAAASAALPHCCNEMQLRGREGRSRSQQGAARRRQRRGVSSGGCGTEQLAAPRESLRSYGTAAALHGTGVGHPPISVPAQTMSTARFYPGHSQLWAHPLQCILFDLLFTGWKPTPVLCSFPGTADLHFTGFWHLCPRGPERHAAAERGGGGQGLNQRLAELSRNLRPASFRAERCKAAVCPNPLSSCRQALNLSGSIRLLKTRGQLMPVVPGGQGLGRAPGDVGSTSVTGS